MIRFILLCCSLLFLACEEEQAVLPAYRTELADLLTDSEGRGVKMRLDNGKEYAVLNPPAQLPADTLSRVISVFTQYDDQVRLADCVPVLTPHVSHFHDDRVKYDPVKFAAVSLAPNYLNLLLDVLGTVKGTHYFGANEIGYQSYPNGTKTLCVKLIHDQNADSEDYTRRVYLSIPLRPLDAHLVKGRDSIQIRVQQYQQELVKTFPF